MYEASFYSVILKIVDRVLERMFNDPTGLMVEGYQTGR